MSTKFEQLLDLLVNEDMEGANALFHEIVVEKSRSIYENLIAEEDEEEMDESKSEDDEEMDESMEDEDMDESRDEEADESMDLEDSYSMEADDGFEGGAEGDDTDEFGASIGMDADDDQEMPGHEKEEDSAIMDIKNAIQELEAAFAELEQAQSGEKAEMGFDDSEADDEADQDEMMGMPMEGRRMTREYVEQVGVNWDKGQTQKQQGQYAGAGTGDKQSSPVEGKSPVSSGKGKPETGANASNILGDKSTTEGHNTGNTPNKVNKGITPEKSEQFTGKDWETNSAPGGKAGVKNLKKQGAGYPGNNKTPGPVGSGTGDKAGQTSGAQGPSGQFLPQHTRK
jgi:hypothetical protein